MVLLKIILLNLLLIRSKKNINKGFPNYGKIKLRNDEPFHLSPDLNKLKKFIKFRYETPIEKGLKKTILYYKKFYYEKNISF